MRDDAFSPPRGSGRDEHFRKRTMSGVELERFVVDVKADPRFQAELKQRGSGLASVVEIARSRGYEITTDDVRVTGNLPLVHGEVLVNGLCRKERTAAAGTLGQSLKAPLRVRTQSQGGSC
jgi:predicted ribosomally synthesized peptide with nif11-like leader